MIIECPYCESKVDGDVIGEHETCTQEDPMPFKAVLLRCPICNNSLLGGSDLVQVGPSDYDWTELSRLWPKRDDHVDWEIPPISRNSLVEAIICFKAKAYSACAVMSGRALEGLCKHYKTQGKTLAAGLKQLKDKEIIDKRLYTWSEELRKHRNMGAHATEEKISKEDAKDMLDLAQAICNYVFVLNAKFDRFMQRKTKTTNLAQPVTKKVKKKKKATTKKA